MYNLIHLEFIKFKNNFHCVFFVILTVLISIFSPIIGNLYTKLTGIEQILNIIGNPMWNQFMFIIICAICITFDISQKTITSSIVTGYTRLEILFSKFIIIFLVFLLTNSLHFFISFFNSSFLNGFGFEFNLSNMFEIVILYINYFIILFGGLVIYFFLSICFDEPTIVMVVSIILLFCTPILIFFLNKTFNLPNFIYENYSTMLLNTLLVNNKNFNWQISLLKTVIFSFISFFISYLNFSKKEF